MPVPLFLAPIASSADQEHEGSKFSHYVSYGFRPTDVERIEASLGFKEVSDAGVGLIFRVGIDESLWDAIQTISAYAKQMNCTMVANVRLASENPAEYLTDDLQVANRVAEAMITAAAHHDVTVFLDTFMDLDRGYFPRIGLYDRRCNRRLGSYVFAHLQGVLNKSGLHYTLGECKETDEGKTCVFEASQTILNLFLPGSGKEHERRRALLGTIDPGQKGTAKLVNLVSGVVSNVTWKKSGNELALTNAESCSVPSVFILDLKGKSR